jgi:hypothetical protein
MLSVVSPGRRRQSPADSGTLAFEHLLLVQSILLPGLVLGLRLILHPILRALLDPVSGLKAVLRLAWGVNLGLLLGLVPLLGLAASGRSERRRRDDRHTESAYENRCQFLHLFFSFVVSCRKRSFTSYHRILSSTRACEGTQHITPFRCDNP